MKRRRLQLSPRHRWALYAVGLALLITGALWAWLHRLDETGHAVETLRAWKPWLLKIHGFAALGFVLLLGTLLPVHVRHSWHARRNRPNGALFLSTVSVLTLSGYALYYLGNESWRAAASAIHLWLGIAAPILLAWHVRTGRRATRGNPQSDRR